MSFVTGPEADAYFLAGLLHCGPCNQQMSPMYVVFERHRFYSCSNTRCPRPHVEAEETENAVWDEYQARNEGAAEQTTPGSRSEMLAAVLSRVTVGLHPRELDYEWRD